MRQWLKKDWNIILPTNFPVISLTIGLKYSYFQFLALRVWVFRRHLLPWKKKQRGEGDLIIHKQTFTYLYRWIYQQRVGLKGKNPKKDMRVIRPMLLWNKTALWLQGKTGNDILNTWIAFKDYFDKFPFQFQF